MLDHRFENGIEIGMPDRQAENFLKIFDFFDIFMSERTPGIIESLEFPLAEILKGGRRQGADPAGIGRQFGSGVWLVDETDGQARFEPDVEPKGLQGQGQRFAGKSNHIVRDKIDSVFVKKMSGLEQSSIGNIFFQYFLAIVLIPRLDRDPDSEQGESIILEACAEVLADHVGPHIGLQDQSFF